MSNRLHYKAFFILPILLLSSCSKDEELELGPGVDYLPYYSKNTYGFDGSRAISSFEQEKNKEAMLELKAEESMEEIASKSIERFGGGDELEVKILGCHLLLGLLRIWLQLLEAFLKMITAILIGLLLYRVV